MAEDVDEHLVGHRAVALAGDDVQHRLDAHQLRERGRRDRVAEILPHVDDLLEHLLEAVGHVVLRELRLERAGHAPGELVVVREHVVLVGDADRMSLLLGDAAHVVADPSDSIEVDLGRVTLPAQVLDGLLGRRHRRPVRHRPGCGVQHLDAGLDTDQVVHPGDADRVVALHLDRHVTGRLDERRHERLGPFRLHDAGRVLDVDGVGDAPAHELADPVGEPLVGVHRADAVHDRRRHLAPDVGDDAAQPLHRVHVVEAVVDPEAVDAVLGERADPQLHQRVGRETELGDAVAARPGSEPRGRHPRSPQVEPVPRVFAVVPHHALEDRAAGEVDDAVARP